MSSSTSSSRRVPKALLAALLAVACVEVFTARTASLWMNSDALFLRTKLQEVESGPPVDILILGDSQAVAALHPDKLAAGLPENTRIYNFGLPAVGPTGAEIFLKRYLERHPPPKLIVVANTARIFIEDPRLFANYTVRHLLNFDEVLLAAQRDGDFDYVLQWLATRLPTLRHRDAIRTGLASLVFDALPELHARAWGWLRGSLRKRKDFEGFLWEYTGRKERNERYARDLALNRGWRYWVEVAHPIGVLPDEIRFVANPFHPEPREVDALESLLVTCHERGIPVLLVPLPFPRAHADAIHAQGGENRVERFWSDIGRRHPGTLATENWILEMPHRSFSDQSHVNARGLAEYTAFITPLIANAYAEALAR